MPETPDASTSQWLPPSRQSPARARRLLASLLSEVAGGHRYLDVGLLLVSELVTNAVLHGTPRDNLIYLTLDVNPSRLRIDVHDARADRAPVLRAVHGEDESGRGLILVKALSLTWGCCPRADAGKITWAEIAPTVAA